MSLLGKSEDKDKMFETKSPFCFIVIKIKKNFTQKFTKKKLF